LLSATAASFSLFAIPLVINYGIEMHMPTMMVDFIVVVSAIFLLCGIGVANALLGTIGAGFTISATIHAFISGGSVDTIFIWKEIFEFLNVSSFPIKILVLIFSAFLGAAEAIASYLDLK
jgi:hypothetical protein